MARSAIRMALGAIGRRCSCSSSRRRPRRHRSSSTSSPARRPNEQVTSQFCCPGGDPERPDLSERRTEAGFSAGSENEALSGLACGAALLSTPTTRRRPAPGRSSLTGCASGAEFTGTAGFFKLNWPTDSVEFQVGLAQRNAVLLPELHLRRNLDHGVPLRPLDRDAAADAARPQHQIQGCAADLGRRRHRLRRDRAGQQGLPDRLGDRRRPDPFTPGVGLPGRRRPHLRPARPRRPESSFLLGASPSIARFAPGNEIAADQSPGHLDREPEPIGEPGLAGTDRAARGHRHLHARTRPTAASRSSSSKPKNRSNPASTR